MGFFLRWLVAFTLLAGTYNPTQWNYASWARANWEPQTPLALFLGLLLLVGYIIYLRATLRSIGAFGMGLVLAIVGSLMWVLYDYGCSTSPTATSTCGWRCWRCRWCWASG